jgi:hypothetical protein
VTLNKLFSIALISGTALVAFAPSAMALDAKAFADSISSAYALAGYNITFGDAVLEGDKITISGLSATVAGGPTEPYKIDTPLTFTGVAEVEGGYTAQELTVPDVNSTIEGVTISIKDIKVGGLWVPAAGTATITDVMQLAAKVSTGAMVFSTPEGEVVSLAAIVSESQFLPSQGTRALESMTGTVKFDGLKIDLSSIKEPADRATIDGLGINTMTGSAFEEFSWTLGDGHIDMSEFSITLDGIGKLTTAIDLTGYTTELLTGLMKAQETAEAAGGTDEEKAAAMEAVGMEMLMKLAIGGAKVRYDDAGFAGKALEFSAAQSGSTRADLVAGLNLMVPAMLSSLGTNPLIKDAGDAISAFLNDPKNIEISMAPASPLPLMSLMGAAGNTDALIDMLAVKVVANQ